MKAYAGRTSITIPVNLDDVQQLEPGAVWTALADADACEVYVVIRNGDDVRVHALAVRADQVNVSAGNVP
jgi:hypothetical protein